MASVTFGESDPLLSKSSISKSPHSSRLSPSPHEAEEEALDERQTEASCYNRFKRVLSYVTVEPAMFLHSLSAAVEGVFETNMIVDKTCLIKMNYSEEVCAELDSGKYVEQQDTIQQIANRYNMYTQWIELGPPVLVLIFLGVWSDTRSRRLPLLLPMIGATLKAVGLMANAYFWTLQPYFILFSHIPYGLCGNIMAAYMAAYVILGDLSGTQSRTSRLSIAGIMYLLSSPIGRGLGAALYRCSGYTLVFAVEVVISALSAFYVVARFDDKPPARADERDRNKKILSLDTIKTPFKVVFRERENGGRAQILGHIVCISLFMMSADDDFSFLFLYTRKKYDWNYFNFTVWSIFKTPISIIAACVVVPFLSYRLSVRDTMLSFIASISQLFYDVLMGTAPTSWVLYLAVVLAGCKNMGISCSRGALSKLVVQHEMGAVFSVIGIGEALLPLAVSPAYTAIYNSTLEVFPGTVFLVLASVSVAIAVIYVWLLSHFEEGNEEELSSS
ncbi:proton-coupled folate transporter-like [Penaeus japonicus]|uniref:proton-coupled folate transporter-like n=1 Tax=Penaeus japonicus TaxID=27405 RepID=UPI001C70F5B4|nr:proton-coupled folate transporter-like [Penaeus japonicus]XP_042860365.1 proton-coupled folate transporter-like [Penaeus japonicus]